MTASPGRLVDDRDRVEQADDRPGQLRLVQVADDPGPLDEADLAVLLGHDDDHGVGLLGDAEGGAMAGPEPLGVDVVSASGRTAPAATIRSSRMITAPSCSGERGMKIVWSRSAETSPWIITPVSAISSSPSRARGRSARRGPPPTGSAAARATSVGDLLGRSRIRRREQPAERPDAADPLEGPTQLRLEDDDEGEQPDDRPGLEDLGQQPQVERDGQARRRRRGR